jgi:hypothetical protein
VSRRAQQALQTVKAGMATYANKLVDDIQRGVKVAFASAISLMLQRAVWIVGLALLVVLFIPELPLRAKAHSDSAARAE